jgi:photosystem II stability/assembly factor-like uncharacterized protein
VHAQRLTIAAALCALAIAAAATPALAAPVSVGHSGWTWGDPIPQGNTLNNVAFAGARGFAVGEFGTVLRSDDGGSSWIGLPAGTKSSLSLVQEVDANTVVVGGGCTVRESVNGGESFQRMPINESEGSCPTKVASFSFLNASTGFVEQASGSILLTTNGGQTLQPKTPVPLNGATASTLEFRSATVGFALTGGGGGRIFRTTDGANSWTQVASSPAPLSDISFVSATRAYAVGANSTLLQSTDAGASWTALALALPAGTPRLTLTHISCSDVTHCLIATAPASGGNTNVLVRTTDGGLAGSLVSPSGQNLLAVAFSTASNAVAVGQDGATVLSSDGGATFATLVSHTLGNLYSRRIRVGQSALDAYALGGTSQIAATLNGGESWNLLRVPSSVGLSDVAFPTTEIGYTVNGAGTVFRTADAGLSWSILSSAGGTPAALLAPSVNTVLLTGARGVRRSTNAGASFAEVNATVVIGRARHRARKVRLSNFDLSGGAQIAGGAIFAYGSDVLESTDGGTHWALIPRPLPKHAVAAISFVSPTSGYETSDGRVFFTDTRGRSWREVLSIGAASPDAPGQMSFSSALKGYVHVPFDAGGSANVLLRTENGGRSWTPESLPAALDTVATAGAIDYAGGENGTVDALFRTTDGGLSQSPSTLTLSIAGSHKLSVKKLRRGGNRVRLSGRLSPALGGATVAVSHRAIGYSWHVNDVTVTSSGTFTLTVGGVTQTTDFVAQWLGEGAESGAGTQAVRLTVSRR